MQIIEFDTIVIGSGLAGLSAAWYAAKHGSVAIVTKSELDTSNSYYAQGGIAAALAPDDTPELHFNDTLIAGRGLCDHDAVEVLVNDGRDMVSQLIGMGMPFDTENGKLVFGLEGGHSRRRILHAGGGATGRELTSFLLKLVMKQESVSAFEYHAAVKLIVDKKGIAGVQAFDFSTGTNLFLRSGAVILATGGLSRIYSRSTNPYTATGDGIALAYEAGAHVADLEFIQFHPTALHQPGQEAFLISEAVRGEGAILLDINGSRFMQGLHPLAELAPRDIVAYSIFKQMKATGSDFVYLSLRHLDPLKIITRFSNIYGELKESGLDLTSDLIPVSPASHYMVGGIRTGLSAETNVHGLLVCGEAASTGVMGANRLASNSLLECLVFGKKAGEMATGLRRNPCPDTMPERISNLPENEATFLKYKNEMADLMTGNLGIIRNKVGMESALKRVIEIGDLFSGSEYEYNILKIRNIALTCKLIIQSALIREESRGGHIRTDFPSQSPKFCLHIIQQTNNEPRFEPVRM